MLQHTKRQGQLFEMHCFTMFSPPFVTFLVKVPLKFHLIDALAFARLPSGEYSLKMQVIRKFTVENFWQIPEYS